MASVRFGVIGLGNMGTYHAKYLNKGEIAGATLAAVADVKPDRLEWARKELTGDVKHFASGAELVESGTVDAILVATPHYDHPTLAAQAFAKGLHVLIEKPAGVSTGNVREMNAAAAKSGKVFGIMFNQRTIPAHQKLRDLVQSGELGAVVRTNWIITNWFRSQAYYNSGGWRATWAGEGGGVLLNQCPHNLDLWQWICGMPKRVRAFCAFGKYHQIEVEDDVTAYVEYENGATGVFITSTGEAPGTNRLEIICDRGKVVWENNKILFYRNLIPTAQFCRETTQGFATPECWTCEVPFGGDGSRQHEKIAQNFTDAVLKGSALLAPGAEGVNSLELSNAMLLSAWTDAWVNLPTDAKLFEAKLQERIKASTLKKTVKESTTNVAGTFNA